MHYNKKNYLYECFSLFKLIVFSINDRYKGSKGKNNKTTFFPLKFDKVTSSLRVLNKVKSGAGLPILIDIKYLI